MSDRVCVVPGCDKHAKYQKGTLCGKHYMRLKTHGSVDVRYPNSYKSGDCEVAGCDRTPIANNLCTVHYQRKYRHGSTDSLVPNYGQGRIRHEQGYVMVRVGQKYKMEHVVKAELALGKPLPPYAVVHHANNHPRDNRNCNLVVCPDQEYHFLLHRRSRELGWPNLPAEDSMP